MQGSNGPDERGQPKASAAEKSGATSETTPSQTTPAVSAPVDRAGGKKKKRRRYSRGLKQIQQLERGVSRSATRLSRAVERGLASYWKRSNKSSRNKRDGVIRDFLPNMTRGVGRTMRVASKAPSDIAKRVNTKRVSRQIRDAVRLVAPPLFR